MRIDRAHRRQGCRGRMQAPCLCSVSPGGYLGTAYRDFFFGGGGTRGHQPSAPGVPSHRRSWLQVPGPAALGYRACWLGGELSTTGPSPNKPRSEAPQPPLLEGKEAVVVGSGADAVNRPACVPPVRAVMSGSISGGTGRVDSLFCNCHCPQCELPKPPLPYCVVV